MSLPLVKTPEYEIELPSTGEPVIYRPFTVKEEKVLYMALEGEDDTEINHAIQVVLKDCILTPGIDVLKLPSFDIEYLFLRLRAKSVSEEINLRLRHPGETACEEITEIAINCDDIEVLPKLSKDNAKIQLSESIGVVMKYPTMNDLKFNNENNIDKTIGLIARCIGSIWDNEDVYTDFSQQEAVEFVESLPQVAFEKIMEFFNEIPKLTYDIKWICGCGENCELRLEGLRSFFG